MCGICGVLNFDSDRPVDTDVLRRMTDIITHRGPDDSGAHVDGRIGLGFRRLSIIDLDAGHQPMSNETGDTWIVFNGEIYNHADLRPELVSKGHVYRTKADTETIIHLYEEEGVDGFLKMNGMFGFAIWDAPKQRLILARDRLGIKPVYYAIANNALIFGSEIKSILEHPDITPAVNEPMLKEQLVFRYLAGEETLFKGIYKLLPGHMLIWENGSHKLIKYWDVSPPETFLDIDEQTAMDQLEELLQASVKRRLMSDVPLGTFCSGGVDSGLTTAYARKNGNSELNTFSIGFHETDWDESPYAQMMADKFNTRHHIIKIDSKMYADSLTKLIWHHDEPLYHPSSGLVYHVSELARKHVTVVLTGEGADELFGGYPRFLIPREYARFASMPGFVKSGMSGILSMMPSHKFQKLGYFMSKSKSDVALLNSQYVRPEIVDDLLTDPAGEEFGQYRRSLVPEEKLTPANLVQQTMYLDLKTYIPAALHRQDKMSMAVSLESRVPFLDHHLVEWGMKVPLHLKIQGMRNKYVLKKLGELRLPHEAIYRQKVGFGVPVVDWLREDTGLGRFLSLFSEPEYRQRGYVNADAVSRLVKEHLSGKYNHCEALWNLINLEVWHRVYVDKSIAPPVIGV